MRTLALLLLAATLDAAGPILFHDFEGDTSGWIATVPATSKLSVAHEKVRGGKGALALEYEASAKQPAAVALPIGTSLKDAKVFRLWLMSETPTAVAIALVEKDPGGRYSSIVWLQPSVWQRVELAPSDFQLSTGADDPKDPDGHLDLDQLKAIVVMDISQILSSVVPRGQPLAVMDHSGRHTLYMDDFEVSPEAPAWAGVPRDAKSLGDFSRPQIEWFTLGGVDLNYDETGKVMPGKALRLDYEQSEDHFPVISHLITGADLTGATHLAFDIASDQKASLAISIEPQSTMAQAPRYSTFFEVPGGNKVEHREIALSLLDHDERSPKDPNGKLDLAHIKTIGLVDFTGVLTHETKVNSVRLGPIKAVTITAQSPADPPK